MYPDLQHSLAARGVTHWQYARRCGISASFVSHILAGRKVPSLKTAVVMAREAQIPIESLLRPAAPGTL